MSKKPTAISRIELTEREIKAVEMRRAGLTFHEIAQALGMGNASVASRYVNSALERWEFDEVDELRKIELTRLDHLTKRMWPYAAGQEATDGGVNEDGSISEPTEEVAPDLRYIRMYLRISDQRAKLTGMYAAEEVTMTHKVEMEPQVTQDLTRFMDLVGKISGNGGEIEDESGIVEGEVVEES